MKVMKRFILGVSISLVLFGCGKESGDINKETKPKIQTEAGSYTIDINSYSALAGDADYVIIGEVIEELGIDYKWPVILENEDGSEREETIPFTNYSVKVIENLKGELTQEKLINITKRGGISMPLEGSREGHSPTTRHHIKRETLSILRDRRK